MLYSYSFVCKSSSNRSALAKLLRQVIRIEMDFSEADFNEFRQQLTYKDVILTEIERKVACIPEPIS